MKYAFLILLIVSTMFLVSCSSDVSETMNEETVTKDTVSDCPRGQVDCSYPGECGQYVDSNDNQICDHSE